MSEISYSNWAGWEPNDASSYDSNLRRVSPPKSEKCLQICRGWSYLWNDAVCEIPMCSICEIDLET